MEKKMIWKILFIIGLCPLFSPFITFLYTMIIKASWSLFDWLLLYSFVYWPTYIIGLVLISISLIKLKK